MQKLPDVTLANGMQRCNETRDSRPRVLILGGTGEGAQLAAHLSEREDLTAISSLAGRVSEPKLPKGIVRVGGFGGLDALASYLVEQKIKVVIDATHPFATQISQNAEAACNRTGVSLIALIRPPWKRVDGDLWHEVDDFQSAAKLVDAKLHRVFLSIGRQELGSFSHCHDAWFLIRSIESPIEPLPPHHTMLLRRGPFALKDELQLLRDHSINYVVSKNSGGVATYAKIEAARSLGLPVVMVRRPFKHFVETLETMEDAIAKVDALLHNNAGARELD
jgi:precorrin-6A/cobalt-precorrin-6A reductase